MTTQTETNVNMKKRVFVRTPWVDAATVLTQTVQSQTDCRMGAITGPPGSGKSEISKYLSESFGAIRLCAYTGISRRAMVSDIAACLAHPKPSSMGTFYLMEWIKTTVSENTLILIDEADCLGWRHLEVFRWLADEHGASIILFGTGILERTFSDPRSGEYLARMSRRIGTKRVAIKPFTQDEVALYILQPRFTQITQAAAKLFHQKCTGNWGEAVEIARACEDIAVKRNETKLSEAIVREALELRK